MGQKRNHPRNFEAALSPAHQSSTVAMPKSTAKSSLCLRRLVRRLVPKRFPLRYRTRNGAAATLIAAVAGASSSADPVAAFWHALAQGGVHLAGAGGVWLPPLQDVDSALHTPTDVPPIALRKHARKSTSPVRAL